MLKHCMSGRGPEGHGLGGHRKHGPRPTLPSFPGFIEFRQSKAWDPFTRDRCQMTLNWTESTTTPTHPDPLPPSSQHKPFLLE